MFGTESQPSLGKHSHSKRGAAASTSPFRHGEGDLLEQTKQVKRPGKQVPAIDLSNPNLIFEQLVSNYGSAKPKA
jgi:hypothetical protein